MVDLTATNDPITPAHKRALAAIYQQHPALKRLLDNAKAQEQFREFVGALAVRPKPEYVFGCDPARGPDHFAVTVFEKQSDGSLTMVASKTQTDLKPPPEFANWPFHWLLDVRTNTPEPYEWVDGVWLSHGNPEPMHACEFHSYRYLAPAEWLPSREETAHCATPENAALLAELALRAETIRSKEARIAALETEVTALRTERDTALAALNKIDVAIKTRDAVRAAMGMPRAHDFGMGCRTVYPTSRTVADTMAKATGDAQGGLGSLNPSDDPRPVGPADEIHEAVERVIGHIADGKVTPTGRQALRGALDKAEAPPTGRAASDQAIGRIARLR